MAKPPALVLLVDDDMVALDRLGELLREAGYHVVMAASAHAARSYVAERPLELLISAHRLIGSSGLDLIRQCRARLPGLPCILLIDESDGLLEAEARRQRIVLLQRSTPPAGIQAVVAEALATIWRRQRWPRRRVSREVRISVNAVQVRLLDVSYGGLGFVLPASCEELPPSFAVHVPTSSATIGAELVWSKLLPAAGACRCGAAVSGDPHSEEVWRAFVDAMP